MRRAKVQISSEKYAEAADRIRDRAARLSDYETADKLFRLAEEFERRANSGTAIPLLRLCA